jgi:hypothetical protein
VGLEPTLLLRTQILSPHHCVLARPSLLRNYAFLSRGRGCDLTPFSVPFGSVLLLLLPHCCHGSRKQYCCKIAISRTSLSRIGLI